MYEDNRFGKLLLFHYFSLGANYCYITVQTLIDSLFDRCHHSVKTRKIVAKYMK